MLGPAPKQTGTVSIYLVWLWYRERRRNASPSALSIDQTLAYFDTQFTKLEAMLSSLRLKSEGRFSQSELGKAGLRSTRQVSYSSGAVYTGELDGDFRDGIGRLVCTNGDSYEGEWKHDQRSGFGVSRWRDGSHYLGFFRSDQRWGPGEYYYVDGSKYAGEWSADDMDGLGMQTFEDGRCYFGQWKAGKREGVGRMRGRDGSEGRGMWAEGKRHGVFWVNTQGEIRTEKWLRGKKVRSDIDI